ncbi:uncharacterized protein KIAA1958-like [Haliotis asinina]|uniref:uncharacterized protein KIAA1958-like n=1 Tax=Haliotis asinina TaxID=109174 RepID=UPI003531B791
MCDKEDDDIFLTQNTFIEKQIDKVSPDEGSNLDMLDDFKLRFGDPLTSYDLNEKLKLRIPKSTQYKNTWAMEVFQRWQEERRQRPVSENLGLWSVCLRENLLNMDAEKLNMALKYFVFEARKKDGAFYPSTTLYGLFASLASSLKLHGSSLDIFNDDEFEDSRRALDASMRERSAEGMGPSTVKHTEVITLAEKQQLWEKGVLGDDTPQKLLDTVLYLTGLHFALRGGTEHRSLRMGNNPQITGPHTDCHGRRYMEYTEDVSKTNKGGLNHRKLTAKKVRAYENLETPSHCYVRIVQKYMSYCAAQSLKNKDAFYFTPRKVPKGDDWFMETPVGHNKLQNTVGRICGQAGILGRKTNHSLRATAATRLYEANVDEQIICEQTGHRSDVVRVYKRTADAQKAAASDIVRAKKVKKDIKQTATGNKSPEHTGPTAKHLETSVNAEENRRNISLAINFN